MRTATAEPAGADRGQIEVRADECKGCGLCIVACPIHIISAAKWVNRLGYHPAVYLGHGCTACGICFYVCPEPAAITVFKRNLRQ